MRDEDKRGARRRTPAPAENEYEYESEYEEEYEDEGEYEDEAGYEDGGEQAEYWDGEDDAQDGYAAQEPVSRPVRRAAPPPPDRRNAPPPPRRPQPRPRDDYEYEERRPAPRRRPPDAEKQAPAEAQRRPAPERRPAPNAERRPAPERRSAPAQERRPTPNPERRSAPNPDRRPAPVRGDAPPRRAVAAQGRPFPPDQDRPRRAPAPKQPPRRAQEEEWEDDYDWEEQDQPQRKKWYKRPAIIIPSVIVLLLLIPFGWFLARSLQLTQAIVPDASLMSETAEPENTNIPELGDADAQKVAEAAPKEVYSNPKAVNLLLLGLDTRDPEQFKGGRTDSMIIVTFDTVNKEIKLTSIMRDTLVAIDGHGLNRINTVFGFNGPDAAMKTVQKYFGVKIDYYAVVNFWAVANIIDSVGGVEIEVKSSELSLLNRQLDEINRYSKDGKSAKLKKSGKQKLNGKQAVSYMRIRHVGEADFERTERQRRVLQAIADKDFSLPDVLSITNSLPNNVRTNANQLQMVALANSAFGLKGAPIKQMRMPIDGSYKLTRYKGMSVIKVDFDKNAAALKKFLQEK